ncbi:hypothetical protein [Chryseobacterium sp. Marseille-Q3244]|uniref:hypothetical protein n=1 Tax=Chryseobacterium sp. Marseille-Q3244 TaxID=2758092 RepID=UPI002024C422|nr:hypothetical protein [Chryseobacterium sp. Marseille-Q3244]
MMYTNEFFAVGNTAPNDDLVQLIDSFTGENVNFKKVSTWIDETLLVANDSRVLNDEIIYRSRGNDYYVNTVIFSTKRVYVTMFGAKSSYTVDQRASIQKAFDITSQLGLKLVFPSGHFLVNSYTDNVATRIHSNIFELRSYLDIEFEDYSVLKVGTYFDDKPFLLFSGFNAKEVIDFMPIYNITLKGRGVIDFNGQFSQMRTSYMRRIGFEGGNCTNVDIDGLYWTNGDLSNCIGAGWEGNGNKVTIQNCVFEDLAKSIETINYDHSTIYGNANFLSVHNNIFIGNEQMRLIGCACEIHASNSSFSNNKVYNYTRMNFIAGIGTEKGNITNISISDNIAEIVNSGVYIWPDKNCTISNLLITSNNIKHSHVQGKNNMLYNGGQALFVIQGKGGNCQRITVKGNTSHILYTEGNYSRVAAGIFADTESLEISDNNFIGHYLGILFDLDQDETIKKLNNYSFVKISGNNITAASQLVKMVAEKVNYCLIANNSTVLEHNGMADLITIESPSIQSTTVRDNIYISNQPKIEFTPSSVFLADPSNKAKYVLSLVSTPVPSINAGASVLISPVLSSNHKRVGGMYTIQPTYPFPELFFNAHTFGAGGTMDVKFKVDNMTSSIFSGNPNLVSNLIINL